MAQWTSTSRRLQPQDVSSFWDFEVCATDIVGLCRELEPEKEKGEKIGEALGIQRDSVCKLLIAPCSIYQIHGIPREQESCI